MTESSPAPRQSLGLTCSEISRSIVPQKIPGTFSAMIAFCSDLDGTRSAEEYRRLSRFLNTKDFIPGIGEGVELEVGNSIYFFEYENEFSYWNCLEVDREFLRTLMKSGHIDCLHSFGNLATTREHAVRVLDELSRSECWLQIWVDHALSPTNFGAHIPGSQGDLPGAPAYHADISMDFGIRWVWRGRVTSVIGQSVRRRYLPLIKREMLAPRLVTVAREVARVNLARAGSKKYSIHAGNSLTQPVVLRDGGHAIEFIRSNPHPLGVMGGDTGAGLPEVLSPHYLDALEQSGGFAVLYTHLARRDGPAGYGTGSGQLISAATKDALCALAERSGTILVTTTRRLLGYVNMRDCVRARLVHSECCTELDIDSAGLAREELQGLTFSVPDPFRTRVLVDGVESDVCRYPRGVKGGPSISFPWRRLEFPDV